LKSVKLAEFFFKLQLHLCDIAFSSSTFDGGIFVCQKEQCTNIITFYFMFIVLLFTHTHMLLFCCVHKAPFMHIENILQSIHKIMTRINEKKEFIVIIMIVTVLSQSYPNMLFYTPIIMIGLNEVKYHMSVIYIDKILCCDCHKYCFKVARLYLPHPHTHTPLWGRCNQIFKCQYDSVRVSNNRVKKALSETHANTHSSEWRWRKVHKKFSMP
jgi:hypothetical protein